LETEGFAYINGEFVPKADAKISIFDQGFIFGDGVYDTLVVRNGFIFKLIEHLDRLYRSAKAVKITIPMSKAELKDTVIETVRRSGLKDAYLKLIVTRGIGDRPVLGRGETVTPTIVIFAVPPVSVVNLEKLESGARLISTTIRRPHHETLDPRVKSLNYLPNMLMRLEAIQQGADEAISYDYEGHVTEGGAENLFVIKDGRFKTPEKGILEGITRETIIEMATEWGYEVQTTNLTKYDLYNADEVFLCSSAGGVFPVTEIDGVQIGDGTVGTISRRAMEAYERMLAEGVHGTPVYETG
jgi:branched-chain amino acid aminotransferase